MAIKVKCQLLGTAIALASMKKSVRLAVKKAEEGVKEATMFLEGEVKESIAGNRIEPESVDTGQLLNSVTGVAKGEVGKVFSNVKHATYMEYGTSKVPARSHFRNSLKRNKTKIQKLIKDKVKEVQK